MGNKLTSALQALLFALIMGSCRSVVSYWPAEKRIYVCHEDSVMMIFENQKLSIIDVHPNIHDTIAVCDYEFVNKEFIEIDNHDEPFFSPLDNLTIEYENAEDSTSLIFDIPNVSTPLTIKAVGFSNVDFNKTATYTQENIEQHIPVIITIDRKAFSEAKFLFSIKPCDILDIPFKSEYGINNGEVEFKSWVIPLLPDKRKYNKHLFQKIRITIPYINDDTFTKMLILKEFVRVTDNRLYWRGMIFEKVSTQAEGV